MNDFNLSYNSHHNVRLLVADKKTICIDQIPPDGIYDSVVASLFDDKGNRTNSKPIKKSNGAFVIQFNNIRPGRYLMTCFKKGLAFEKYGYWFGKIPIAIGYNRSVSFEKSPVYENNISCFQKMASLPINMTFLKETPSRMITQVAKRITQKSSNSYDATLAIHDYISRTISYDMDSYSKILRNEAIDYKKVSDASSVLTSGLGVCSGFSNLAVSMLTSIGITAKTILCFALGKSTEGRWSKRMSISTQTML